MQSNTTAPLDFWVSPSQLDLFIDCNRKWAWRYLHKYKPPPNPSAALGTAVHDVLKTYLETGFIDLTTNEGEIALAGIHQLPPPLTPGMKVEKHFGIRIGDALVHGYKDVYLPLTYPPTVIDHKTSSSFGWAKTQEVLRTDFQAVSYALHAMAETGHDTAFLRWLYYRTKGARKSMPVDLVITKEECSPTAQRIDQTAKLIQLVRRTTRSALELPPNPLTCDKYGGCPYEPLCNLSPQEKMISIMTQDQNAFAAQLQAKLATQNQEQQAQSQLPYTTLEGNVQLPQQPQAQPSAVQTTVAPQFDPSQLPPTWQPPQPPTPAPAPASTPSAPAPGVTVTSVEVDPLAGRPPQGPAPQPQNPFQASQQAQANPFAAMPQQPLTAQPPPQQAPQAPQWATQQQPPNPFQNITVAPPEKPKRGRRSKEDIAREKGFVLYIDCAPIQGKHENYHGDRENRIQNYLRQGAELAQAVQYDIEQNPPINGMCIFTTPDTMALIDLLIPLSRSIIRGFRNPA